MPELPEVETVRRGLEGHLERRRILAARSSGKRLRRPLGASPEALEGLRFQRVGRRGKYLLLRLDNNATLVVHLGMAGQLLLQPADAPAGPHDHLVLDLEGGDRLVFRDPRRFGFVELVADSHPLLAGMGPEPLETGFTAQALMARGATSRNGRPSGVAVKERLLDQAVVAGVGNIYASEALHGAGIDPRRPAGSLSAGEFCQA